jgi:hypothetical protein
VSLYQLAAIVLGPLQLILVVQKLVHFIDWSWWLALSPLWLVCAVVVAAGMFGVFK